MGTLLCKGGKTRMWFLLSMPMGRDLSRAIALTVQYAGIRWGGGHCLEPPTFWAERRVVVRGADFLSESRISLHLPEFSAAYRIDSMVPAE
jgi:hypothetical protein